MTTMTIPRQRAVGRDRATVVHHAKTSRSAPWISLLWRIPLTTAVALATVGAGCWIVDQLSIVDFGATSLLVAAAGWIVTGAAFWRWYG